MGFFGDLHKLNKQGKELRKTWDPGAAAQDSLARMRAINEQMEQTTQALTDGVPGTASVVTVGPTSGMMNMNPMMRVDLLVTQGTGGGVPRPVSLELVVPITQTARVYPGATLPVRISPTDPNAVVVMWDAPLA
jgi:hypothetical protein